MHSTIGHTLRGAAAIYLAMVMGLIVSQSGASAMQKEKTPDAARLVKREAAKPLVRTEAIPRKGETYQVGHLRAREGQPFLVMSCGPGWHGAQPAVLARAEIFPPSMRRRIIGHSMLKMVGVGLLDSSAAISFNMPRNVADLPLGSQATTSCAWWPNQSYAPCGDWQDGRARGPGFHIVVGGQEDAFNALAVLPATACANACGRAESLLVQGRSYLVAAETPAKHVAEALQ